jgi:hypothetical protein
MNYLPVDVYSHNKYGDCTNNGVTFTDADKLVNFVYSSDGRFRRAYGPAPVAVHDRIEA